MISVLLKRNRGFFLILLGMLVLGGLGFVLLRLSGCEPDQIVAGYGQRRGETLQESVNGTFALARLFEQAGHSVSTWRRLSPRIRSYDTLVWIPNVNSAPSTEERDFLDRWLADSPGRTLVYVGRDFDNASLYWSKMKANAPAEQVSEIDSRLSAAEGQHGMALANGPHLTYARWFVVRPGPHYPVTALDGPWAEGVDDTAIEITVGTRLMPATNDDKPVFGTPLPTFAPAPVASAPAAPGGANAVKAGKAATGANTNNDAANKDSAKNTVESKTSGTGPTSGTEPTSGTGPTTTPPTPPAPPVPPPAPNQGPRTRRRAPANTIFGQPAVPTAEAEQFALPNSEVLLKTNRGDPLVRRVYDGVQPFDAGYSPQRRSQVIVVTNGSFLLNMGLVNREHRKLAARLVEICGPPGNVAFLESGPTGLAVLDKEPQNTMPSGLGLFTVYPLNILLLHLIGVGLLFCFTAWPIFGRAKRLPAVSVSDFGAHVEAVGELLEQTRDRKTARLILENYQKVTKETR